MVMNHINLEGLQIFVEDAKKDLSKAKKTKRLNVRGILIRESLKLSRGSSIRKVKPCFNQILLHLWEERDWLLTQFNIVSLVSPPVLLVHLCQWPQ